MEAVDYGIHAIRMSFANDLANGFTKEFGSPIWLWATKPKLLRALGMMVLLPTRTVCWCRTYDVPLVVQIAGARLTQYRFCVTGIYPLVRVCLPNPGLALLTVMPSSHFTTRMWAVLLDPIAIPF